MNQPTLAGCQVPDYIYQKFPYQVYACFISSTSSEQIDSSIPETIIDIVDHIEKCGQSNASMGTEALINSPYSTRLLELDGLADIRETKSNVLLESMEIYTYDPKITGSTFQNNSVNTEISNSIATGNQVLIQSQYLNGMVSQAQPNFIRPSLSIDNRAILRGIRSAKEGVNAIGLPTPLCRNFFLELPPPKKIEFFCGAGAWIPQEAKVRRLFVLGVLNFRLQV